MRRTTPGSSGCTTFVRPDDTVLPDATATMSSLPRHAHASATQNSAISVRATQRDAGDTGVSISSRCAGRNSSSCAERGTGSIDLRCAHESRITRP